MEPTVGAIRCIPGHARYGCMEDGTVWSIVRGGKWKRLVGTPCSTGYLKVKLKCGKTFMVHTLIALTFIGKRPRGKVIGFKDGNKLHIAASNLEYVTESKRNARAWERGVQSAGWAKRRARLKASGHEKFGRSGGYPGKPGRRVKRGKHRPGIGVATT